MVSPVLHIPNEVSQRIVLAGFEASPGVPAVPDFQLLGDFTATKSHALNRKRETTGSYVGMATPRKQVPTYSGNYGEDLTFESWAQLLRATVRGGATGALVPGSAAVYDHTKAPSQSQDDIEAMTVHYGVDGLGFESRGVTFNEHTLTIDCDDADGVWKFAGPLFLRSKVELAGGHDGVATGGGTTTIVQTGAGWTVNEYLGAYVFQDFGSHIGEVRQVVSNTVDTLTVSTPFSSAVVAGDVFRVEPLFAAGIPIPQNEPIQSYGTKVFLDPYGTPLGTTQVTDRIISTNVTMAVNRTGKRFLENRDEISARTGRGDLLVTGQIRFEGDRRDEWREWERLQEFGIRIEQEGSEIEAGFPRMARVDVRRAVWDEPTDDTRESNLTNTLGWVGYIDTPYVQYTSRIGVQTLV